MLDHSRSIAAGARSGQLATDEVERQISTGSGSDRLPEKVSAVQTTDDDTQFRTGSDSDRIPSRVVSFKSEDERSKTTRRRTSTAAERKTISEVLHDIYDEQAG